MVFKVLFTLAVVTSLLLESGFASEYLKPQTETIHNSIPSEPNQPTTATMSPLIIALTSIPMTEKISTEQPVTSTKPGQDLEEDLVQKLRLYLSLLDQHIKLSGRPRFGRSVPLILPTN